SATYNELADSRALAVNDVTQTANRQRSAHFAGTAKGRSADSSNGERDVLVGDRKAAFAGRTQFLHDRLRGPRPVRGALLRLKVDEVLLPHLFGFERQ